MKFMVMMLLFNAVAVFLYKKLTIKDTQSWARIILFNVAIDYMLFMPVLNLPNYLIVGLLTVLMYIVSIGYALYVINLEAHYIQDNMEMEFAKELENIMNKQNNEQSKNTEKMKNVENI